MAPLVAYMAGRTGSKCFTWLTAVTSALLLVLVCADAYATGGKHKHKHRARAKPTVCRQIADAQLEACVLGVASDYWNSLGVCANLPDAADRRECNREASAAKHEDKELCREQRSERRGLCKALGENRYEPEFDPAMFETDFENLITMNPYFPLLIGSTWTYEGGDETIVVEVLDETKLIEGVTCVVIRDVVEEDGELVEDTDDWYGQATNGDVYYCGEISQNFEYFDGDEPENAELVDIEGSWKAGRDGDLPGIIMFADPVVGTVYRQEFSLGNAEDAAEVLSNSYGFGTDPELDWYVPSALANALCNSNCVVTREFTPVEPGMEARKYYAPGIGLFLEVDMETGETVELVECNLPGCAALP